MPSAAKPDPARAAGKKRAAPELTMNLLLFIRSAFPPVNCAARDFEPRGRGIGFPALGLSGSQWAFRDTNLRCSDSRFGSASYYWVRWRPCQLDLLSDCLFCIQRLTPLEMDQTRLRQAIPACLSTLGESIGMRGQKAKPSNHLTNAAI